MHFQKFGANGCKKEIKFMIKPYYVLKLRSESKKHNKIKSFINFSIASYGEYEKRKA